MVGDLSLHRSPRSRWRWWRRWKGQSLRLDRGGLFAAMVLGVTQFCVNFNSVYLAEQFITSGVVATVFALLLIPNSLLAWAFLGQKPNAPLPSGAALVAIAGVGLLFLHELRTSTGATPSRSRSGSALTMRRAARGVGGQRLSGGQGGEAPSACSRCWPGRWRSARCSTPSSPSPSPGRRCSTRGPAIGSGVVYLALAASVLCFSLYFPVVRKIGPGKAAYSSVIVPIIAMACRPRSRAIAGARSPIAGGGAGARRDAAGAAPDGGGPKLVTAPDAA